MREIKFRGKHIHAFVEPNNTEIWVYGYLCNDHYINSEELMGEMFVDKNTVGQFTGLKDVDGTEIYENMIINNKYIVVYDFCKFALKNIKNGNITDFKKDGVYEITGEYFE